MDSAHDAAILCDFALEAFERAEWAFGCAIYESGKQEEQSFLDEVKRVLGEPRPKRQVTPFKLSPAKAKKLFHRIKSVASVTGKSPKKRLMEWRTEFYPYTYYLGAANTAIQTAKTTIIGKNHHYMAATVFCAFAVEAALNHAGLKKYADWNEKEKEMVKTEREKLGKNQKEFEAKLSLVGLTFDNFTKPVMDTVKELFEVRNNIAHGKTWVGTGRYWYDGKNRPESFPSWLTKHQNDSAIDKLFAHADEFIKVLLTKSGFSLVELASLGEGVETEIINPKAQPQKAKWKLK